MFTGKKRVLTQFHMTHPFGHMAFFRLCSLNSAFWKALDSRLLKKSLVLGRNLLSFCHNGRPLGLSLEDLFSQSEEHTEVGVYPHQSPLDRTFARFFFFVFLVEFWYHWPRMARFFLWFYAFFAKRKPKKANQEGQKIAFLLRSPLGGTGTP